MNLPGLVIKSVGRNKVRLVLTVLGVAVTVLTFIFLRTVVWSWSMSEEFSAKDRLVTRHKMTFVMLLPKRYVEDVRNMPQVKAATWFTWFQGSDPKHEDEYFSTFAVDPPSFLDVIDEIALPADQKTAWLENRRGAIVGDLLAKKLGWTVGQKIYLESGIYPEQAQWEFEISGIYTVNRKLADRSAFYFHWNYLNENVSDVWRDGVGWITARVNDPKRIAQTSTGIDKAFGEKEVPTLTQDEHAFQSGLMGEASAVLTTLDVVAMAILFIMTLIVGNTISMGVRERTSEYGALLAIGFLPRQLAFFIVLESLIIGVLGGGLGVLLSYPIVSKGIGMFVEENMSALFPYFRVSPWLGVAALGTASLAAAVAAIIPALQVFRLKVVDALRRVA